MLLEASGEQPLGASTITLAETLVSPARTGRIADAEAALQQLGVAELSLGDNTSGRLAGLRAEIGLKMPDCYVLLAAQEHEGVVASFDTDLLEAASKLGIATAE